jgi:protein-disulfide isomerase-like protein with CxxC motif
LLLFVGSCAMAQTAAPKLSDAAATGPVMPGWVIARATGKSMGDNLQDRIWRKLGAGQDTYFAIDCVGTESAAAA